MTAARLLICADVCVRLMVEQSCRPGSAVEYALEPLIQWVTHDLFGVSQLASNEKEYASRVLDDPRMPRAMSSIEASVGDIARRTIEQQSELDLCSQATVLRPAPS